MKIQIEVTAKDLRRLVVDHIKESMPSAKITEADVLIEVITKQNYRTAAWEQGDFRARVNKDDSL